MNDVQIVNSRINSEVFKRFLAQSVEPAIEAFGGIARVRSFHEEGSMVSLIVGWICCELTTISPTYRNWREEAVRSSQLVLFDEMRRAHDFVRLRIETESSTS